MTTKQSLRFEHGIVATDPTPFSRWILLAMTMLTWMGLRSVAHAQQAPVRITADSLAGGEVNGQPVKQLIGNVQFVQGPMYGSADRATQYLDNHRIELSGHVEIHQDTLALYAPFVTYNDSTGIGHAEGGVRMFDRDNELTAQEGDYDELNQVAYFRHHVTMTQGRSTSVSDSMVYYRSTETSILTGHASVTSDSGSLAADTILYERALGQTTAKGNVHLANDSLRLASDWFYDSQPLGELRARGHVGVEDLRNRTTIFGDTLARFARTRFTLVPKRPLLIYVDSSFSFDSTGHRDTTYDTMFVRADTMKMFQGDSARLEAIDSVRLMRGNFSVSGGTLIYDQVHDVMNVFHAPRQHLWNDSTEIDADSVSMLLRNRHIDRIFAVGHAFATSPMAELPNSGRVDQLQGDAMMLVVTRDTARELYDMSSALSIYFLLNQGKADGVNRASGDTIRLDFKNKAVDHIAILSGTEGEYFPERFVAGRATAFRLTAYERHDNLRPRRAEFDLPWNLRTVTAPPAQAPKPTPQQSRHPLPPPSAPRPPEIKRGSAS